MPNPNKGESKQDFLKRCTGEAGGDADQAFKECNLAWDDSKNQRSVLSLHLPIEFKKSDDKAVKADKFLITAYTGKPIDTWWGQVVFDLAGMQTKEKIPVLREHERDRVVGFGNASQDGKNYYVSGEFSKSTKDSEEVRALADEGYPWQASVAIWPKVVEILENAKSTKTVNGREIQGPAEIWKESYVGEVSFVSLGRDDDTAAISLTESAGKVPVKILDNESEGKNMLDINLELLKKDYPELVAEIEGDGFTKGRSQGFDEGAADERKRVVELLDADADPAETRKMIDDGVEASEAYKHFYEAEKSKRAAGLEAMATEATDPQGVDGPLVREPDDITPIDEKLAKMARELAAKDGIDLGEAQKRVNAQNPALVKEWSPIEN